MSISKLSNRELQSGILEIRNAERRHEVDFLSYLGEIGKRDLHLEWGYHSLFSYLVNGPGYSEGGACRRLGVCRIAGEFPKVLDMLRDGSANLSSMSSVAKILSPDNAESVLKEIAGKTSREVEDIVCRYKAPVKIKQESIKPIRVAPKVAKEVIPGGLFDAPQKQEATPANSTKELRNRQDCATEVSGIEELRYMVQFSISGIVKGKLGRVQGLMIHKLRGSTELEKVLEELLDSWLEENGPEEKAARAKTRKMSRRTRGTKKSSPGKREAVPAEIRRAVFERDGYACSYTSPEGTCCRKKEGLEIDHILPVAKGGTNDGGNLRILCREHNQFFARKIFGREFMEKKIGAAKDPSSSMR